MSQRKLSVIIPIFKTEPYLNQCIDSVINQTFKDMEIILIDDGSPDKCGMICDQYAKLDDRIVVIHKENQGLAHAWNDGIMIATGEWIAFVDSDDWLELNYFEQMFTFLAEKKDVDVICAGGCIMESSHGMQYTEKSFSVPFYIQRGEYKNDLLIKTLVRVPIPDEKKRYKNMGFAWDKIYNANFLHKNSLYINTGCVAKCAWIDALFSFQVINRASTILGVTIIGYHYRDTSGSITKGYNPNLPDAFKSFFEELLKEIENSSNKSSDLQLAVNARAFEAISGILNRTLFNPHNLYIRKDVIRKFRELEQEKYCNQAIYAKSNQYLTHNQVILKHLLRLPWMFPTEIVWRIKKIWSVKNRIK